MMWAISRRFLYFPMPVFLAPIFDVINLRAQVIFFQFRPAVKPNPSPGHPDGNMVI